MVVLLLLGREFLVVNVLAQSGAELQRRLEIGLGVFDREIVIEDLDQAVAAASGQLLVPALHEIVAYFLLPHSQRRHDLGPFCLLHSTPVTRLP